MQNATANQENAMNATPTNAPLNDLYYAALQARDAFDLKRTPEVYRDAANAWFAADNIKAGTVMLGEGAFWVVCLADAARLEKAGFEFAPRC